MAEVITFDNFENLDLSMEGPDVLVMKVDLTKVIGSVKSGADKYASTAGIKPFIAGGHKKKFTLTIFDA